MNKEYQAIKLIFFVKIISTKIFSDKICGLLITASLIQVIADIIFNSFFKAKKGYVITNTS